MTAAVVRPVAIKIDENMKVRVKRLAEARHRTSHWLMLGWLSLNRARTLSRQTGGDDHASRREVAGPTAWHRSPH